MSKHHASKSMKTTQSHVGLFCCFLINITSCSCSHFFLYSSPSLPQSPASLKSRYIYTFPLVLQHLTTTKLVYSLISIQNINILSVHCVLCNRLFPFSWFFHAPAEHPELSGRTSATLTMTLKKKCSHRKCYHLPSSLVIFTLKHPVHSTCLCFKHK